MQTFLVSAAVFVFAMVVRWPRAGQSLWCDEMGTFLDYVNGPWHKVLAGGAGEYVPNNHVLFTILDKLVYGFADGGDAGRSLLSERLIRLPSLMAGCVLPVAVGWPFRRKSPLLALLLAVLVCVHPWLVVFSTEARGYSLMILLGVLSTSLLPDGSKRWPWLYGLLLALMLYTVPVGLLLVAGLGLAIAIFRRDALASWLRGLLITAMLTTLVYLPMFSGLLAYYRHPLPAPDDYVDFVNQLPRFALWGEYLPHPVDLLNNRPNPLDGILYWIVPNLILTIGSIFAWRSPVLRITALALAAPMPIALLVALVIHSAGQVRFVPWSALWMCICIAVLLLQIRKRLGRLCLFAGVFAACGPMLYIDFTMPPSQPVRSAFSQIDALLPSQQPVMAALLTAPQAVALYGPLVIHHPLIVSATIPAFFQNERQVLAATGHRPALVMSYEYLVRDLQPNFWSYVQQHYRLVARFPGRLSPVSIYESVD